jgi:hypothetical protein
MIRRVDAGRMVVLSRWDGDAQAFSLSKEQCRVLVGDETSLRRYVEDAEAFAEVHERRYFPTPEGEQFSLTGEQLQVVLANFDDVRKFSEEK